MKKMTTILTMIAMMLALAVSVQAQDVLFNRDAQIPHDALDVGGFGMIVAGMDLDADGNPEIYAVNNDWFDVAGQDWIPRIYKYEKTLLGDWVVVWSTPVDLDFQNTWPPLAVGDLDNDGKGEVIWGITNNTAGGAQPNPIRIAVFETAGDGTDNMGTDNGDGTWAPNASWTITQDDNANIRPFKWQVTDIDGDGAQEIVSSCRAGDGLQIYSVDDVPDAGGGTETWTAEFSGLTGTFYDVAVIGNTAYVIQDGSGDIIPVSWDGSAYTVGATQAGVIGSGAWNSAQVVDVDNDGTKEIIVASYLGVREIYLLEQSGDSLVSSVIAEAPAGSNRLYGGAAGDTDGDGNLDFVFGTRQSTPNGLIHRLHYVGGAINDAASWRLNTIDSLVNTQTQYDMFAVADLDGDGEDEALYTGTARGATQGDCAPITIMSDNKVVGIISAPRNISGFELKANYPNPFNPETTIEFNIPNNMNVAITIYNMLGQEIRTLVNEQRNAGLNNVKWNGRDNKGNQVASGAYIYTLRAEGIQLSRRMTLLK